MATERTVLVRLRANADPFVREMLKAKAAVRGVRDEIDTTNDRTAWLAQGVLALAPAATTMGAAAIPVLMGLATQATVAVGAVGSVALAFNGVGDALDALNDYQLEPTAANLSKLQEAMEKIGPAGAEFVQFLDAIGSQWAQLGMDAREGMFPGMQAGIESLMTRLPELREVVSQLSAGVGGLAADAGAGVASGEFDEFFEYLATDAKSILVDMGRTLGNFVDGFGSMMVAFGPLTRDFSQGFLGMSRDFERWAENLAATDGFREFVEYVRDNGPAVMDMLGAFSNALVQLAQAAAPVGAVMVPAFELLADAIATIADTPIGTIAILGAALTSLYGRLAALNSITSGGLLGFATKDFRASAKAAKASVPSIRDFGNALAFSAFSQDVLTGSLNSGSKAASTSAKRALEARNSVVSFGKAAAPAAAQIGLLAASLTGVAESAGLSNTAMGGLLGSTIGKRAGVIGAAIGVTLDLAAANNSWQESIEGVDAALKSADVTVMQAKLDELWAELEDHSKIDGFGDFFSELGTGVSEGLEAAWAKVSGGEWEDPWDKSIENVQRLKDGIDAARYEAELEALAQAGMTDEVRRTGEAAGFTNGQLLEMATSTAKASDAAWAAIDAEVALGEALDGVGEAADKGARGLDASTEAGRENLSALSNLAGSWEQSMLAMKDNGASAKAIQREYRRVKQSLYDAAVQMGASKKRARELADQLAKPMTIIIRSEHQQAVASATAAIAALRRAIEGKPITQIVQIRRKYGPNAVEGAPGSGLPALLGVPAGKKNPADGATVMRDGHLSRASFGTTVPKDGMPYADRYPFLLAPGEEVTTNRNGEADLFRAELKDINAGMSRAEVFERMLARGLAEGGTAGAGKSKKARRHGDVLLMPGEQLPLFALGLKALNRELAKSEKALAKERKQRDAVREKMSSLASEVAGGLRSPLFDVETDVWTASSMGGSYESVMAKLAGDARRIADFEADVAVLKKKGLDGEALAELLRNPDAVDSWSKRSRSELAAFESAFNNVWSGSARVGELAGIAAWGKELKIQTAQAKAELKELREIKKAIREEGRQSRGSLGRGASRGVQARKKSKPGVK